VQKSKIYQHKFKKSTIQYFKLNGGKPKPKAELEVDLIKEEGVFS